jgi:hypothetical protein
MIDASRHLCIHAYLTLVPLALPLPILLYNFICLSCLDRPITTDCSKSATHPEPALLPAPRPCPFSPAVNCPWTYSRVSGRWPITLPPRTRWIETSLPWPYDSYNCYRMEPKGKDRTWRHRPGYGCVRRISRECRTCSCPCLLLPLRRFILPHKPPPPWWPCPIPTPSLPRNKHGTRTFFHTTPNPTADPTTTHNSCCCTYTAPRRCRSFPNRDCHKLNWPRFGNWSINPWTIDSIGTNSYWPCISLCALVRNSCPCHWPCRDAWWDYSNQQQHTRTTATRRVVVVRRKVLPDLS